MKIYEVGGCVRDRLMGRKPKDIDYVVVGATAEEMRALGYDQVGADFPVFLHPTTRAEYALARTERKSGRGYHGFTVDASPDTTLEEDLRRRDLTINSMARDPETGVIIDPFNGRQDLSAGVLRHTSEAFAEDPVRVLRVGRFAARYGFTSDPETTRLMNKLVTTGELVTVNRERVWNEVKRSLMEPFAEKFFSEMNCCGAFDVLFPKLEYYNANLLTAASKFPGRFSTAQMMAIVTHRMKPQNLSALLSRLKVPNDVFKMCLAVCKLYAKLVDWEDQDVITVRTAGLMGMLQEQNAYQNDSLFYDVAILVDYVLPSKWTRETLNDLMVALALTKNIGFANLSQEQQEQLKPGKQIAEAIRKVRIDILNEAMFWI